MERLESETGNGSQIKAKNPKETADSVQETVKEIESNLPSSPSQTMRDAKTDDSYVSRCLES